ncbi:MAG: glycerol dehydrogenase [Burkholderiales bacterium]|nr:glycerol dehydrogenase [Burkholderiales bacterium]
MLRIFGSPHRYVQGPGAIDQLNELARHYGRYPFVVADGVALDLLRTKLIDALGNAGSAARFTRFGGECTAAEIDRLTAEAREQAADVVIAVGGGKTIDAAKGVCLALHLPLIVMPTIASNDSPTSRLVVVYTEQHALQEVRRMAVNPDVVLVDTAIIVAAPARFFVSGIGDALSKKFEAAQCFAAGGTSFYGAHPPFVALTLADACYETIRSCAEGALEALHRGIPDEAFERTVEATILLSGLAFENGGLSIAHSLTRGLSTVPELATALHGEQVAFGLLVQLILERRSREFIGDLVAFHRRVGLPVSLRDLGWSGDATAAAARIAQVTWERAPYVRNLTAPVDESRLRDAILATGSLAKA